MGKKRFTAIDWWRGLAICNMLVCHLLGHWGTAENHWVYTFALTAFHFLGSPAFLFLSGITFANKYRREINPYSQKFLWEFCRKILPFAGLTIGANLIGSFVEESIPTTWWLWEILQTILWSQIIGFGLLWVHRAGHILLGVGCFFLPPILAARGEIWQWFLGPGYCPLFPFLGFFLIGIGFPRTTNEKDFRRTLFLQIILGIIGISSGIQMSNASPLDPYLAASPVGWIRDWGIAGIGSHWAIGHPAWCMFMAGINLVGVAMISAIYKLKHFQRANNTKGIRIFGKYSLQIYVGHHILFLFSFHLALPVLLFSIGIIIALIYAVSCWYDKVHSQSSKPEKHSINH